MKIKKLVKYLITCLILISLISCGGSEGRKSAHLDKGKAYLKEGNLDKAKIEFKNVIQIDPKSAEGYYYMASTYEKSRDFKKALGVYKKTVELQPDNIDALTAVARIYLLVGVLDKAVEFSAEALKIKADYPEALAVRAAAAFHRGEMGAALNDVRSALDIDPDNLSSIALLSRIYITQSQEDKAEALLVSALQRKKMDVSLRVLMVQFYQNTKQYEKAAKILSALVESNRENVQYRIQLAMLYDEVNDIDKAEKTLRTAIDELPDNMLVKRSLIEYLAKKRDFMFAQLELSRFIKEDSNNPELKLLSALLYKQTKDNSKSEALYREIVRGYGSEAAGVKAQYQLVRLLLEEKRENEAKTELEALLLQNPSYIDALSLRGVMSLKSNDTAAAISDFRKIIKENPQSINHIKLLAEAFIKEEKYNLAEQQITQVLDIRPTDITARIVLAKLLYQQKQYSDAVKHLNIVEKLEPENIDVQKMLFKSYLAISDYERAMQIADNLKAKKPDNSLGYFYSGLALQAQRKYELSMLEFEKSLEIKSDLIEPLSSYVRSALALKKPELAENKLKNIADENPHNAIVLNLLGEVLLQQKKNKEAAEIFEKALLSGDKWWILYRNLASAQLLLKQTDKAIQTYRDGIEKALDKSRLYLKLAILLESQGELKEAMAQYEEMLRVEGKSKVASNNMALLLIGHYNDQASKDRALSLVDQFQASVNPNFLDTLGWVYFKRGEYDRALSALLQADGLAPEQALIQYHLGSVYFSKGDIPQARKLLEPLARISGSFKGKKDVQRMLAEMN